MYEEFPVQILNKEYKVMGVIENGAEGAKKIVQHINDKEENKYLVKIVPCKDESDKIRYEREIRILKKLEHPNIAKLIHHTKDDEQIMLFFDYYSGGSLADMIDNSRIDEERSKHYFRQLIDAVDFCHQNNIAHRDIKPDNILLDRHQKHIYLADFGLCREIEGLFDDFPGTPLYNSPEKFMGKKYDGIKNDMWCLGITLFEMLTADTPFYPHKTNSIEETARNIVYMEVRFPTYLSEAVKDLICSLLHKTPSSRPSMSEVRKHPWVIKKDDQQKNQQDLLGNLDLIIDQNSLDLVNQNVNFNNNNTHQVHHVYSEDDSEDVESEDVYEDDILTFNDNSDFKEN